jgi:hypothetical protein
MQQLTSIHGMHRLLVKPICIIPRTHARAFAEWDPKDLEKILAKQRDEIDMERT